MKKERHCSFCERNEYQVAKLIAGPNGVYICDECVEICNEILGEALYGPSYCWCCKRSSQDVKLIYDSEINMNICEECLDSFIKLRNILNKKGEALPQKDEIERNSSNSNDFSDDAIDEIFGNIFSELFNGKNNSEIK